MVFTPPWDGLTEAESAVMSRGASGTVSLIPDNQIYERLRIARGPTRYFLPDGVDDPSNQSAVPRVVGGPLMSDALGLAPDAITGNTLEGGRPLGRTLSLTFPFTTDDRVGYNIAGWIPGADPARRDEWILYVAHYDHVGYGEPADGDSIWNGFIDNAAGSSMLLEIARNIAADPLPRSVAFLWVTAEEQGLLGSNWFVHDSPIALDRIRAVINLDGGAPPAPPTSWGLTGADESASGRIAHGVIRRHGWPVTVVANGPQSDHWPFHRAGVPAVLLFPGTTYEGLSDEEASALNGRWYHPHTPRDAWHPDFPFAGLERYASLALEIGRELGVADATTRDRIR